MHCHTGRREGGRKWEERERKKKGLMKWFVEPRDMYMGAMDGLA